MAKKNNIHKTCKNQAPIYNKYLSLATDKREISKEIIDELNIMSNYIANQKDYIKEAQTNSLISSAQFATLLLSIIDIDKRFIAEISDCLKNHL